MLGVWDGHDAGAALAVGGRLVAAVSEERLTRVKQQSGWPTLAIAEVLEIQGLSAADVSEVVLAGAVGRLPARLLDGRYRSRPPQSEDPLGWPAQVYAEYQNRIATLPGMRVLERRGSLALATRRLMAMGITAPLRVLDHHRAHAIGALMAVGGGPALLVTMDGYGDGVAAAIWRADAGCGLVRIAAYGVDGSPALLYGALNRGLGFAPGEEGKVTGLAGSVAGSELDFSGLVRADRGRLWVDRKAGWRRIRRAIDGGAEPASVAFAVQRAVEAGVVGVVRWHLQQTGLRRLGVAGGLFANVALNGKLAALDVQRFAVFAAMGDQGLAAGAACSDGAVNSGSLQVADALDSMRLGPGRSALPELPDPAVVAQLLADGALVGVSRGRMEFGPRALGGRSILFDASRVDLAERLSSGLRRPVFMPYAPVMLACSWEDAFDVPLQKMARAAAEMTVALPVRPAFGAQIRAAVHADGTARPQVVDVARDPWLAGVLARFTDVTGTPALVNTSLNRHREPIVCTGDEALDAARAVGLDALVLGGELVMLGGMGVQR